MEVFLGAKYHIIRHGAIIHTDLGVTSMDLNTDTQQLGYVSSPGETVNNVPESVLRGIRKVNWLLRYDKGAHERRLDWQ